jgi:peptide-methionine (S)-S-oxide reductase
MLKPILIILIIMMFATGFAYAVNNRTNKNQVITAKPLTETAIFAGGCFWCMHAAFESLDGVLQVQSGYTGGHVDNPTYEQVSSGTSGHVEAIKVVFNPQKVAYTKLLEWFWDNVDPTDAQGQFCDKGTQYAAGIFYASDAQKTLAEQSQQVIEKKLGQPVATFLRPAQTFYEAEDYHQSFYKKNAQRYQQYEAGCGRKEKLKQVWQKPE